METATNKITKMRRPDAHTAAEKCEAVLSVWTERRKAGEICREKGVSWMAFSQWQKQAMAGMLEGLSPRKGEFYRETGLAPRLAKLLLNRRQAAEKKKERQAKAARPKSAEAVPAEKK